MAAGTLNCIGSGYVSRSFNDLDNTHVAVALRATTLCVRLVGREQMSQNFPRLANGICVHVLMVHSTWHMGVCS